LIISSLLLSLAVQISPPCGAKAFIVAGQSNASGRGSLTGAPSDLTTTNPHIYLYGNDQAWSYAVEPIDSATGQIDNVTKDSQAAVGPGMAFALRYLELHPGADVVLIPCATGGKTIHEMRRGDLIISRVYGACDIKVRAVLDAGVELGGIIWWQGEADAQDPAADPPTSGNSIYAQPLTYADELVRMVRIWRADYADPLLPVVVVQLGPTTYTDRPYWSTVQDQQALAVSRLPRAGLVTASDMTIFDAVHLDTASQVVIGGRIAEAMTALEWEP
jgi:hypothetical protein